MTSRIPVFVFSAALRSSAATLVALLLVAVWPMPALRADAADPHGPIPIAPATSSVHQLVSLRYTRSGAGEVESGAPAGSVTVSSLSFSDQLIAPLSRDLVLRGDLFWRDTKLDPADGTPLPERLVALGLGLGLGRDFGGGWALDLRVTPGFAGDSTHVDGADFTFSGGAIVRHTVSAAFAWNLGVTARRHGDNRVLPVAGVRWSATPDWTLALGFPETAVSYRATSALSLKLGAEFAGGAYRVATPAVAAGEPTQLDYREVHAGLGLVYRVNRMLALELEAGGVLHRRFDYYDRDETLHGDRVGYGRASVSVRF